MYQRIFALAVCAVVCQGVRDSYVTTLKHPLTSSMVTKDQSFQWDTFEICCKIEDVIFQNVVDF